MTARPVEVGFIGFGRAGAAFALALDAAGHRVTAVSVRSATAAARARRYLPAARQLPAAEAAGSVDVLVLAVGDDALPALAASLAVAGPRAGAVVAHLSGRHGLEPLAPVAARGAFRAALHPIMSLAGLDPAADAAQLRGTTFGVTADPQAVATAHRLVEDIGGRAVDIDDRSRTLYHCATVLGANYLATLTCAAADLLAAAGVPDARAALAPLLRVSLDNALRDGDAASTGPVRRGDVGTLAAHLDALRAAAAEVIPAYAALGRLTADRLAAAGLLPPAAATAVRGVLGADGAAGGPAGTAGTRSEAVCVEPGESH